MSKEIIIILAVVIIFYYAIILFNIEEIIGENPTNLNRENPLTKGKK